ncbi:MAG TPA: diguanylate cyclase [Usitatibacter sp.]|nr:diguanylate cyclase [Usitatibacter sp.]
MSARAAPAPSFTAQEQRWIAEHPVVDYGFNPRAPPFSFEDHGMHRGFSADLMAELGKRTGIRFRPLVGEPWPQVVEKARDGSVALIAQLAVTPEREAFLSFTPPVLDLPYGIFTSAQGPMVESLSELHGKRIGVPRDFTIHELLRRSYPDLTFVPFETASQGIARLAIGEYDAVVANVGAVTYAAGASGVSNVRLRAVLPERIEFATGVSRASPELVGIVQKAFAAIPREEIRAMRNRWVSVPGPGFTKAETIAIAGGVAAVVFMFASMNIAFLYVRLRDRYGQLMEAEGKLQRLATTDELTGLGNRRAYNAAIGREISRADRTRTPLALLELDIDHFKTINDELGHEAGDRALEEIGQLVRAELRATDLAFRVGGEEFVVVMPATDEKEAQNVAERLRASIEGIPGLPRRVTASFGCAVLLPGVTVSADRLFAVADAALYRAKSGGRNRVRVALVEAQPPGRAGGRAA